MRELTIEEAGALLESLSKSVAIIAKGKPLDPDIAAVIAENLTKLYVRDDCEEKEVLGG